MATTSVVSTSLVEGNHILIVPGLLALFATTGEPVVSIKASGWEVPGITAIASASEGSPKGLSERSRWTLREGSRIINATQYQYGLSESRPFWVTTVTLEAGGVRPIEEMVVPYSAVAYALPNERPYCFRILSTSFDPRDSLGPLRAYAIYDQDGDGLFEEIERVNSLPSQTAKDWVPRPKLGANQDLPPSHRFPVLSDVGWRVPGGAELRASKDVEESWPLVVGGISLRAESIRFKSYDDAWIVSARSTARGVSVSHERSGTAPSGVRYIAADGRIFCMRIWVHPWSPEGLVGGLWDWAFYDLDGDGIFELVESGTGGVNEKGWVPRLPDKAKLGH